MHVVECVEKLFRFFFGEVGNEAIPPTEKVTLVIIPVQVYKIPFLNTN
jgi:hypothetical protein